MTTVSVGGSGIFINNPVFGTIGIPVPGLPISANLAIPDGLSSFPEITGNIDGTAFAVGAGSVGPVDLLFAGVENVATVLLAVDPTAPALQAIVDVGSTPLLDEYISPNNLGPISLGLDTAGPVSVGYVGVQSVGSVLLAADSTTPAIQTIVGEGSTPLLNEYLSPSNLGPLSLGLDTTGPVSIASAAVDGVGFGLVAVNSATDAAQIVLGDASGNGGLYIAPGSQTVVIGIPGVETVTASNGVVSVDGASGPTTLLDYPASLPSLPSAPNLSNDTITMGSGSDTVVPAGSASVPAAAQTSGLGALTSAIDTLLGGAASVPSALGGVPTDPFGLGSDSLSSAQVSDFAPLSGLTQTSGTSLLPDLNTGSLSHAASSLVSMDGGLTTLELKNIHS